MKIRFATPYQFVIVGVCSVTEYAEAVTWLACIGIYNHEWWGATLKGHYTDEQKPLLALRFV